MTFGIRPFRPADEAAVVALWRECGLTRPWNDPHADIARKLGEQPDLFLVGVVDGELAATAMVGFDGHRGWVYYLGVSPTHRRRAFGRALMQEAERLLSARGCPKLNLMVRSDNADVMAFYRALGYAQNDVVSLGKRLIHDAPPAPAPMQRLNTDRLLLEPLTVGHAQAMFGVLAEPELYRHLDHPPPPSVEHVRGVYAQLQQRRSPAGDEQWLNWVLCGADGAPIGFVQATVFEPASAWVAYLLASRYWGDGLASEATAAMLAHLERHYGVRQFLATVEAENRRSIALLDRLGFRLASATEAGPHGLAASERLYLRTA